MIMPPSREESARLGCRLVPKKEKVIFYFRFTNGMRNICSNDVNLIAGKGFEDKILIQTGIGEESDYDRVQLGTGSSK